MSKSLNALGLAVSTLALTHSAGRSPDQGYNDGISATEIVIGTHQGFVRPDQGLVAFRFPTA